MLDEIHTKAKTDAGITELLYTEDGFPKWTVGSVQAPIDFEACMEFFSSAWFTRRWVVQEIALAPENTCYCGAFEKPLDDVVLPAAYMWYNILTWAKMQNSQGIWNASRMHHFSRGWFYFQLMAARDVQVQLGYLLESLWEFENDDPRDDVYALLALYLKYNSGLAEIPKLICPDYTLPPAVVLTKAAALILVEDRLDLLNEATHRSDDIFDKDPVPSWVPRYDRKYDADQDDAGLLQSFRADDYTEWQPPLENTEQGEFSTRLHVKGYRIGVVADSTNVMTCEMFTEAKHMHELIREIDAVLDRANLVASRTGILAITLCAGQSYESSLIDPADATAAFMGFEELLQRGVLPPWPEDLHEVATVVEPRPSTYNSEVSYACNRRRFYRTSMNYVGLGPQCMLPGDILAIAFGCQWPVIVRPVPGKPSEYWFVGVTYVYGIMFGEATRKLEAERQAVEEFVLI